MATSSRHMACKTCRDRKVRCDGGQPSCQKCDRAGHTCVYVPATKYSKADLIDAVQSLSERLEATEALLAAAKSPPQQNQALARGFDERTTMWTSSQGGTRTPGSRDEMANYGFPIPRPGDLWAPGMLGEDGLGMGDMPVTGAGMLYSPISTVNLGSQGMEGALDASTTASVCPHPFSTPSTGLSQGSPPTPLSRQSLSGGQLPTLQEIRAWSNLSSGADLTNNRASRGGQCSESVVVEGEAQSAMAVFQVYAAFARAMVCMQLDITGITGAMADYVGWMRLKSRAVNSGTPEGTELAGFFSMLETRTRELSAIASQQMQEALRASRAAFVGDAEGNAVDAGRNTRRMSIDSAVSSQFRMFDKDISSTTGQVEAFFRSSYDIHNALAQQR